MSRKYDEKTIGSIGVDDEGSWGHKTGVTIKVDTLEKATIRFGRSYTLRINEEDLTALRQLLHEASIELEHQRNINSSDFAEDDTTDDLIMEVNEGDISRHECAEADTRPPIGQSKFFSSRIPEC